MADNINEELKAAILDLLLTAKKPQLYLKDMQTKVGDFKPREIKNAANQLVKDGLVEFWSSGSSTMYAAKGRGQSEEK
ncbi:MAG: dissimilatory sulfite reductase D family protein [Proteobacteria bacterium]|nr:dissimilatory sulfite reductase D family protein [Pseudomonadota bacterium]MBU1710243.1 dissimilatory sulfite reductase D family protein [Pseudomonadota bacterium]